MTKVVENRLEKIYKVSILKSPYKKMSLIRRYWIYQAERLPVIPLFLMGLVVGSAVMRANDVFTWSSAIAGTVLVSSYLLQIRFADEPKDFEHDNKFYPTRPVQRGVITLSELRLLRNLMIALFFITALSLRSWQIFILATLQQLYSLLTRKEFFVREWLRAHFLLYMLSHYFQLLILSWLTMTVFEIPSSQKTVYFGFALLLMAVVELARKIQEKDNDKAGDTYSANLGRARAISLFLVVSVTLAMYTTWILNRINADMRALLMVGFGIALILGFSVRYLGLPNKTNTKLLQGSSLLFYFLCATAVIVGA